MLIIRLYYQNICNSTGMHERHEAVYRIIIIQGKHFRANSILTLEIFIISSHKINTRVYMRIRNESYYTLYPTVQGSNL